MKKIGIRTTPHIPDVAAIYLIQVRAVYCGDYVFLEKSPCVAEEGGKSEI
jgi:hypothetical protein